MDLKTEDLNHFSPAATPAAEFNNHMHSDSKKRRSFLALLFAAGDVWRSGKKRKKLKN